MHEELEPGSRVIIVDSSAILKSCFEGYPTFRTSTYNGRALDVTALFGYLYRTSKIYEEFEFEAMVHVIDPPGGSYYRYNLFPDYKGNRKDDDPVLAAQKVLLPQMLEAFGERNMRIRGIESDDVIATLAVRLADEGHQVMILSPDKDLLQLVDEGRISVARHVKDPSGMGKTYDMYETDADVLRVMGVRADQVADMLAMAGDAADNILGVSGVGPKKAAALLAEYGDLNTILTNADAIKGKMGENIRAASASLLIDQKLTNVLRDLPNIGLPVLPQPTPEKVELFRNLLLLDDKFPSVFYSTTTVTATRTTTHTDTTTVVEDTLEVVETFVQAGSDVLSQPTGSGAELYDANVLGELFGRDATPSPTADPFGVADEEPAPPAPAASRPGLGRPPRW